ncbi:MAG TPA: TonB-dependent receptor [Thermoanaerobaculia bacterium]|nr:TonB-dependent receptor [Thermoanaerobaculia bacterium]
MKVLHRSVFLFAVILLIVGAAFGQGTTGALNGTVEQGGAPLPGATITITSPALQGSRAAISNVNGDFNFVALPPGDYSVKFEMEGMSPLSKTTHVGLARTERVNAEMKLSAISEAITVTASAPAVLESTEVQANYTQKLVEDLPIPRTIQGAVQLAPGVTATGPGGAAVVGGGYAYDTLYLINGAVTNENVRGQTQNLFIEDAVQETTILTGAISAEYGRFSGGVVSAITKSGGNQFSGSFRDSLTNPSWDKTTPFGEPNQKSALNQVYEATLGGRIIRDRLWFFGAGRKFARNSPAFFTNSTISQPTNVNTDKRYEGKLTGQITQKHSLVASYLDNPNNDTVYCPFGCFESSAIDLNGRSTPSKLRTAHYNGIITSNFLVEGGYSARRLTFHGGGGDHITKNLNDARDIALGTAAFDYDNTGAGWGAPVFCGPCDDKIRENKYYQIKGTYYAATKAIGTHNVVLGYENFAESRKENNFQSGSNFLIYTHHDSPEFDSAGVLRPVITAGDEIVYTPVPTLSIKKGSDFVTKSVFANDKWDFGSHLSFNIGARYDKNDGVDSAGNPVSKDSNISPRLGVIYDIAGDGRFKVNASYSKYVSKIAETIGGAGGGGNPWYIYYEYDGPDIGGVGSGLDSFGVLTRTFQYLINQGGLGASQLITHAKVPGFNTRFDGSLKSPNVDEFTVGVGTQLGQKGLIRADYIDRKWNNFYGTFTRPHDQVANPITKVDFLDVVETANTSNLERTYRAVELQGSYHLADHLNLGGNYTYSQAKGNTVGESTGLGGFADPINQYREFKAFDRNNPSGFLPNDQTHKLRLWAGYDLGIGFLGNLNVSVLERFDSATPYSAAANVSVNNSANRYVTNPGYATAPTSALYYFSDRGAFRWEKVTATDLALNWGLPIFKTANFFVQGELLNAFNESAQTNGNTTVTVIRTARKNFNPFTTTPVEGVDWKKGANFGKPRSSADFQTPLTYRVSLGVRF